MTTYCPHCGYANQYEAKEPKKCKNCNEPLDFNASYPSDEPRKSDSSSTIKKNKPKFKKRPRRIKKNMAARQEDLDEDWDEEEEDEYIAIPSIEKLKGGFKVSTSNEAKSIRLGDLFKK